MSPYRDAPIAAPILAPSEGIVDDMVRQFADPYAFLRELVQNGIDAGATRLDVRIERGGDGNTRTTVADDGCGMSRATIEGPLLTLFESSKENDPSKIGKYGIGFVSVFAINPSVVEVATWQNGESWLLRLFADHSYELATAPPREGHGTEVTLVSGFDPNHESRAESALRRWCQFARIPITFGGENQPAAPINATFTISAEVTYDVTRGDSRYSIGIGAPPFAGFYNRGLTLLEATVGPHLLAGVSFMIDSPRLAHTMSRDDVRRDHNYEDLRDEVMPLVRGPATEKLQRALNAATSADYEKLLHAAASPAVGRLRIPVPLVERTNGLNVAWADELTAPVLIADASSPLTKALAAAGRPVVRGTSLARALAPFMNRPIVLAESLFTYLEASVDNEALAAAISGVAAAVGRGVAAVRIASFHGHLASALFRTVRAGETLIDATKTAWTPSAELFLNANHELVRLARRRAKSDVRIAAHLLFRALLLETGALLERDVDRLLEAARRT